MNHRSHFLTCVAVLVFIGGVSEAFGQTTIYWKKDYIADANGAPIATATPAPADQIAPSTPTSLTHSAVTFSYATLDWNGATDNVGGSGVAGYKLYRNGVPVGSTSGTTFTDNTVEASKTYSYTVVAVDWAGNHSSPSSSDSVSTTSFSGPSSLSATRVSSSRIDLSWTDASSDETGFLIERKIGIGGRFLTVATASANATSYENSGLNDGTVYYYRIRAAYAAAASSPLPYRSATSTYSNDAYACTCSTIEGSGTYDGGHSSIAYTGAEWDDDTNSYGAAVNSTLHYSKTGGDNATFSFDGSTITWVTNQYPHLGIAAITIDGMLLAPADLYSSASNWQVPLSFALVSGPHTITVAVTDRKNSAASDAYVMVDAFAVNTTLPSPAAPGNLSASAVSSSQIAIQWTDNSHNEAEFKIERKVAGGSYSQLSPTAGANNTQYLDAGLSANTTYFYRIRSSNSAGDSGYSDEASAATPDSSPPGTPTVLIATATSTTSVSLAWTASSDNVAVDHYEVQRRSSGSYSTVGTPTSASLADTATAGVAYLYRVRAVDSAGNTSNWSNLDLATTVSFADDPLTQYSTSVKAQHFTELRTAVNYVRATAALSSASWAHSSLSSGVVYAVDLQELRDKLGEARAALGLSTASYTDSTLTQGSTVIKKAHIEELRGNVK